MRYTGMMQKTISWKGLAEDSEEQCRIVASADGIAVRGDIIGTNDDDTFFSLRYELDLTADWHIQRVAVHDALNTKRVVVLQHEGNHWLDANNEHIAAYDDVDFVDISRTPLTNSIPIRQLTFTTKKSQKIKVLYIDATKFEVRIVEQVYSRLDDHTYHYQDIEVADFAADIVVDDEGLVIAYPGLFRRA
jgi:hypothetical protein